MRSKSELRAAHKHSSAHRKEIEASVLCACYYCQRTFAPSEIKEWLTENVQSGETAFCPHCGIDSVLGDASGYPILDKDFLAEMHAHWFGAVDEDA